DLYRWDLQSLLIMFPDTEGHATGREPPHIDVMGGVSDEANQIVLEKHGRKHGDIVQMPGTLRIRGVHDDVVVGFQYLWWNGLKGCLQSRRHHTHVERRSYLALR